MRQVWTAYLAQKVLEDAGFVFDERSGGFHWEGPVDGKLESIPTYIDPDWLEESPAFWGEVGLTLLSHLRARGERAEVMEAVRR